MAKLAMRMRRVMWPGGRGKPKPHIWNQRPQFTYSLYNLYGAMMMIKGSLHCKVVLSWKFFIPSKVGRKRRFFGNKGLNIKILFSNPKRHILVRNHVVCCISRENRCLGCGPLEEPRNKRSRVNIFWCAISQFPWGIVTKFCMWVDRLRNDLYCVEWDVKL